MAITRKRKTFTLHNQRGAKGASKRFRPSSSSDRDEENHFTDSSDDEPLIHKGRSQMTNRHKQQAASKRQRCNKYVLDEAILSGSDSKEEDDNDTGDEDEDSFINDESEPEVNCIDGNDEPQYIPKHVSMPERMPRENDCESTHLQQKIEGDKDKEQPNKPRTVMGGFRY